MLSRSHRKLSRWMGLLGIEGAVRIERISRLQVIDERGDIGSNLVGIVINHEASEAVIVTTRRLREDDIVHELTHFTNPELGHDEVEGVTATLLENRNTMYIRGNGKEQMY